MTAAERDTATVHVIAGPTASGKSALALALAERLCGVVINGDSMQVYRGLEVLTDQPSVAARRRVPHRLYGIIDPAEACSAGRWRTLALAEIAAAARDGQASVIAGGSGLYLKALTEGIAPIPDIPAKVRAAVRARMTALGPEAFHAELAVEDPEGAAAIGPSDRQRMVRAAEVLEATGRPLAHWQAAEPESPPPGLRFRTVLLMPPRADLYAAIEVRFGRMIQLGALAEAEALAARSLDPGLPAMKALGVAELIAAARGEMELGEALSRAKTATRNYAKRQVTWFKRQMIADVTFETQYSERFRKKMLSEIL